MQTPDSFGGYQACIRARTGESRIPYLQYFEQAWSALTSAERMLGPFLVGILLHGNRKAYRDCQYSNEPLSRFPSEQRECCCRC